MAVTADPIDAFRWASASFQDLSLEVRHATDLAQALVILDEQPCDLALVAPDVSGASYRDMLRRLRATREDLPVVLVGALDACGIRDAIALGASDVVAPYDLDRLGPALLRALREAVLATALQRARAEATLIDEALRRMRDKGDPVTGLPQRAAFERQAQAALADTERDGTSLGVLFLDVDRFRSVNELGDHNAGDAVLREIAARLRDALPHAYVARFGGDEFVMLCNEEMPGAIRNAADAAIAAIGEPFVVAGKPVHLTASVGIATAPDDAGDVTALVGQAETAVFEAKRCGRNTVRWYRATSASSTVDRMMLRHDLHHAIERNEFELYYQPMYDVETRAIHAVEALVRWRHPVHGMLLPDRFIPLAEECGMIDTLGAWVLDRALAQLREWADVGIPSIRVSVNVSARQLEGDTLPAHVATLLARHGVAASCLEIEITESSIMRDVAAAARLLRDLRALGVRVSIDDFGIGYTSLGFLKRFPVDVLKIDRSFVADVAEGAFDNAVVRAVTTLARGLGVRTVAEGVEVQAQFDRLRALDCDVVQGFLFCRPISAADCTPLLARKV